MNVENQRLKEQVDKLRIDCNALEEHVEQLKQKQYKQEVVLFFFFFFNFKSTIYVYKSKISVDLI
jgi:uncharacterized membrane protein YjjP (DUF1212 family)